MRLLVSAAVPAFFSAPWAAAVGDALNASAAYRAAAAPWVGAVRFVARDVPGDDGPRTVWLDLHHGACDGTRTGPDAEAAAAAFVIVGTYAVWTDVLAGRLDPLAAMSAGALKVTGDMGQISRHVEAAREMVVCAAAIETILPG